MRKLVEKLFIILFALYNSYNSNPKTNLVLYFLISLIISLSLDLFNNKKFKIISYFLFIIACFTNDLFLFYLPLILYNMYIDFGIYALLASSLLLLDFNVVNLLLTIISIYFSNNQKNFNAILDENKFIRDQLKEDTLYLKKYNEQLKIQREKDIHIAILTERNRIARELHDSIGHTLSSSILQIEALKVISKENNILKNLNLLQKTLNNGMNDIRSSIHNLYKESFNLESKIKELYNNISYSKVELIYNIKEELDYNLKLDILSIVKEAITNCVKHSNATKIKITLLSQPKFYSIIVKDNGNKFDKTNDLFTKGIGLASMKEIANKYNGLFNYSFDNGFKIHLTLMKG